MKRIFTLLVLFLMCLSITPAFASNSNDGIIDITGGTEETSEITIKPGNAPDSAENQPAYELWEAVTSVDCSDHGIPAGIQENIQNAETMYESASKTILFVKILRVFAIVQLFIFLILPAVIAVRYELVSTIGIKGTIICAAILIIAIIIPQIHAIYLANDLLQMIVP